MYNQFTSRPFPTIYIHSSSHRCQPSFPSSLSSPPKTGEATGLNPTFGLLLNTLSYPAPGLNSSSGGVSNSLILGICFLGVSNWFVGKLAFEARRSWAADLRGGREGRWEIEWRVRSRRVPAGYEGLGESAGSVVGGCCGGGEVLDVDWESNLRGLLLVDRIDCRVRSRRDGFGLAGVGAASRVIVMICSARRSASFMLSFFIILLIPFRCLGSLSRGVEMFDLLCWWVLLPFCPRSERSLLYAASSGSPL